MAFLSDCSSEVSSFLSHYHFWLITISKVSPFLIYHHFWGINILRYHQSPLLRYHNFWGIHIFLVSSFLGPHNFWGIFIDHYSLMDPCLRSLLFVMYPNMCLETLHSILFFVFLCSKPVWRSCSYERWLSEVIKSQWLES